MLLCPTLATVTSSESAPSTRKPLVEDDKYLRKIGSPHGVLRMLHGHQRPALVSAAEMGVPTGCRGRGAVCQVARGALSDSGTDSNQSTPARVSARVFRNGALQAFSYAR